MSLTGSGQNEQYLNFNTISLNMFFYWLRGTIFTLFNFTFRATFDQKSNELLKLIRKEGTALPQKQSLV